VSPKPKILKQLYCTLKEYNCDCEWNSTQIDFDCKISRLVWNFPPTYCKFKQYNDWELIPTSYLTPHQFAEVERVMYFIKKHINILLLNWDFKILYGDRENEDEEDRIIENFEFEIRYGDRENKDEADEEKDITQITNTIETKKVRKVRFNWELVPVTDLTLKQLAEVKEKIDFVEELNRLISAWILKIIEEEGTTKIVNNAYLNSKKPKQK